MGYNLSMRPFRLAPQYREYVWGGRRLRPRHPQQTAEAWIVYEENCIVDGPLQAMTLAQAAEKFGPRLLGEKAVARTGLRFPLLVKILDCAAWLSLQVHPDDRQAQEIAGQGQFGKTEAWHVLQAQEGAQLISGIKPGTGGSQLKQAIQSGKVIDLVEFLEVRVGDSLLMLPGTVHALGPGLLIYEVQQTSDLTYRVYDWGRQQTPERRLHLSESLQIVDAERRSQIEALPILVDGEIVSLCRSDYFHLQRLLARTVSIDLDTSAESFHALTAIQGEGMVAAGGDEYFMTPFDTLVLPADCGAYTVRSAAGDFHALLAQVP